MAGSSVVLTWRLYLDRLGKTMTNLDLECQYHRGDSSHAPVHTIQKCYYLSQPPGSGNRVTLFLYVLMLSPPLRYF
jgi:hypothetical protein